MTLEENITAALESGRQKADAILALRAVAQSRRADALQKNQNRQDIASHWARDTAGLSAFSRAGAIDEELAPADAAVEL